MKSPLLTRVCTIVLILKGIALADLPLRATRVVGSGLGNPIFVTQAPGDNDRLFIANQGAGTSATIEIFNLATNTLNPEPFATIGGISTGGEQGLLGLAFHPDYASNGLFYVKVTSGGQGIVRQYSRNGSPDLANSATFTTTITYDQPASNHNGGWIGFSPNDGYLYIATGDGGGANDDTGTFTNGNAQEKSILLGKILRLHVNEGVDAFPGDADRNYAIPSSNPFFGSTGDERQEIWAYGLRNPWRNSFDRSTGALYIGDVGQNAHEEVNFQAGTFAGGANYGWRAMEGELQTGLSPVPPAPPRVDPIHTYVNPDEGRAVTGGYVYRGSENETLNGTYFFADYSSGRIWSFKYDGQNKTHFRRLDDLPGDGDEIGNISSWGEDNLGRLYIVDIGGEIFRLVPAMPGDANLDNKVDIKDLRALALNWGVSGINLWDQGDFSDDDLVNVDDLTILARHWQDGVASSSLLLEAVTQLGLPTSGIPEPTAAMSVLLLLTGFAGSRVAARSARPGH